MSATRALRGSASALHRIDLLCDADLEPGELIQDLAEEIASVIPVDAYFLSATDPHTLLALGGGVVHAMDEEMCTPFWSYEFEVPDFNKFADLARSNRPVADLHEATGGRPERSARWRILHDYGSYDAELRGALTAGGRTWGVLHLNREGNRGFDASEIAFVEAIAPLAGAALRRGMTTTPARDAAERGPGMAIFDADDTLLSATAQALEWFEQIDAYRIRTDPRLGVDVPYEVLHVAQTARARAMSGDPTAEMVRTRARTRAGGWVLVHGSSMRGAEETTAVVVERAKASEVAPLIVEAYQLTARELDVTHALARGLSTNEIAAELHLSRYTVQDHLKSIYEKTGVAGRSELMAKMFADHYHDRADTRHV